MAENNTELLKSINLNMGRVADILAKEKSSREEKERDARDTDTGDLTGWGKHIKSIKKSFTTLGDASEKSAAAVKTYTEAQKEQTNSHKKATTSLTALNKVINDQTRGAKTLAVLNTEAGKSLSSLANTVKIQTEQYAKGEVSLDELTKSMGDLKSASTNQATANDTVIEAMVKYKSAIEDINQTNGSLDSSTEDVADAFANLLSTLDQNSIKFENLSDVVKSTSTDFNAIQDSIDNTISRINDNSSTLKAHTSAVEDSKGAYDTTELDKLKKQSIQSQQEYNTAMKQQSKAIAASGMAMGKGISNILVEVEKGVAAGLGVGFEPDGFTSIVETLFESIAMGVSPSEAAAFAGHNRMVLTSLQENNNKLMNSSNDGLAAAEDYGDMLLESFGVTGQSQLKMLGEGFTILANSGIQPNVDKFKELTQSVENMAKTSDMSAAEIFSSFSDMSKDRGFQSLITSMGSSVDATSMLSESFLYLQQTVGLNAKEFLKYRKQLHDEINRTGVERVVQSSVAGDMATSLGFSDTFRDLIERGTQSFESLSLKEQKDYTMADTEMKLKLGERIAEERKGLGSKDDKRRDLALANLTTMETLSELSGKKAMLMPRDRTDINQMNAAAQAERLRMAGEDTSGLLTSTRYMAETMEGLAKSPFANMVSGTTMVTAGVFGGLKAAKMFGVIGTSPFGPGVPKGPTAPGMGMNKYAKGLAGAAVLFAVINGISAGMKAEGDLMTKSLTGISAGIQSIPILGDAVKWASDIILSSMDEDDMLALGGTIHNMVEYFSKIPNALGDTWDQTTEGAKNFFWGGERDDTRSREDSRGKRNPTDKENREAAQPSPVITGVETKVAAASDVLVDAADKAKQAQLDAAEVEKANTAENTKLMEAQLKATQEQNQKLDDIKNAKEPDDNVLGPNQRVNRRRRQTKMSTT